MTKPIKPNITIPEAFAVNGQKADFLDEKIQNGFSNVDPDVLAGDNLNKLIDDTYKGLNYSMDGVSDLYKSLITYDSTETYGLNSIVFNIEEEGVALYQSLIADNTGNALTDEAKWQRLELGGGGAGQPIGSLFWSFAAADYVPDYALACDGTEYSSAMFTGLWNSYLTADVPKLLTKNYTQYQADITAYGSCAAFGVEHSISAVHSGTTITEVAVTMATWENKVTDVGEYVFSYDGTDWSLNSEVVTLADYGVILTGEAASGDTVTVTYAYGTHFKVPKINNTIYQGLPETVPVVGNGTALGLTSGSRNFSFADHWDTGAIASPTISTSTYGDPVGSTGALTSTITGYPAIGVTTDAAASGLVAKLSDNVKAVALRCFVVVANKSDNETEFDWSEWASSLAGKANIDASNFSSEGKSLLSGLGMPSNKFINLSLASSHSVYTAPANGYFYFRSAVSGNDGYVAIYNIDTNTELTPGEPQVIYSTQDRDPSSLAVMLPVLKNQNVVISYSNLTDNALNKFRFIYAEGEETE